MNMLLPYLERVQINPIVGPISIEALAESIPANTVASDWYASLGEADQALFVDLSSGRLTGEAYNLDLVDAVGKALVGLPHLRIGGVYERRFRRGEGEGRHNDPHDIVVTQTNGGSADFSLWADRTPTSAHLEDGDILLFQGRIDHQVGPAQRRLRLVRAVGIDYVT